MEELAAHSRQMGPILIVLTTRSYALTSDFTGVANAVWPLKTAK